MNIHDKLVRLSLFSTLVLVSYLFTFWNLNRYTTPTFAEINSPYSNLQRDVLGGNDDEEIYDTEVLSSGKVLSLGSGSSASYYRNIVIYRYNSNGTIDTTFNGGLGYTTVVENKNVTPYSMVIQNDGKIVVTGDKYIDGTNGWNMIIWRFNSDGTLDTSFNGTGIVTHHSAAGGNGDDTARDIKITSSGKIIVVGDSKGSSSFDRDLVVWKYNTDGTLDTSFDSDGIFTVSTEDCSGCRDFGYRFDIDSNNKIVIAGVRNNPGNEYGLILHRVNENGGLDTTFNSTGHKSFIFNGMQDSLTKANRFKVLSNGKYLIVGETRRDGPTYDYDGLIVRVNPDSSYDTSFNSTGYKYFDISTTSQKFHDFIIEPNGKYVLVGEESNGQDMLITRINDNGEIDSTFGTNGVLTYNNIGGGNQYERANSIAIKDNKYYIGGISEGATTYLDSFMLVLTNTYQVKNLTGGMKAFVGENEVTLGTGYGAYGSQTLRIEDSSGKYITNLNATFNNDLDFSSFVASSDSINYKSYVGALTGITGVTSTYDLYIPKKEGDNVVGLCPNQVSFENISTSCTSYSRIVTPESMEIGGNKYWKLPALTSPYGAFSQDFKVKKVKIDSIGLITKIPEKDSLKYYFLSSTLEIKGSADPNVTVKFKLGDTYYSTLADSSGTFSIEIKNVPTGSNVFSYFAVTNDNIESEKRALEIVLGCENFTKTLKDIYCPDTVEEENSSTSSTTSPSSTTTSSSSSTSSDNITILFRDNTDSPILGISVFIGDKTYVTDNNGAIKVDKTTAKGETKILVNGQTFIQDLDSKEDIKIIVAIDPSLAKQSSISSLNTGTSINKFVNISTIPYILGCLILTFLIIVIVFILRKRKKKEIDEEVKTSP